MGIMQNIFICTIFIFAINAFSKENVTIWYEPLTLQHTTATDSINIQERAFYKLIILRNDDILRISKRINCYKQRKYQNDIRIKVFIEINDSISVYYFSRFDFINNSNKNNCLSAKFLFELFFQYLPDRFKEDYKLLNNF
jgi:hypothetical protein